MAIDAHRAAIHFRIAKVGATLEGAISQLRMMRVFQGRMAVMQAAADLQQAAGYAQAAPDLADLADYLTKLAAWYQSEAQKVVRPTTAPKVADELFANQGQLLGADPTLPTGV